MQEKQTSQFPSVPPNGRSYLLQHQFRQLTLPPRLINLGSRVGPAILERHAVLSKRNHWSPAARGGVQAHSETLTPLSHS